MIIIGMGTDEIGITMEPQTHTDDAKGQHKEDENIDSASVVSDAPTVPHFNISVSDTGLHFQD